MAIEKKWNAIPPQTITSDGTTEGQLGVTDATVFFVKQTIKLFSNTVSVSEYQVKRVINEVTILLGSVDQNINDRSNLSSILVADDAMISADEQFRPAIPTQDHQRAVYQEEPAVALRVYQVDSLGRGVSATSLVTLAPASFDRVHEVLDADDDVTQYQFFLAGLSVGNINVIYNSDKVVTDYVKA